MDLRISELLAMQRELQELHRGDWADVVPSTARDHLLWGVGEIGEVIDIIKKRGDGVLISLNPAYAPVPMSDNTRCNGRVIGVLDPAWIEEGR